MRPTKPICRYYGGKWKLADWIISFFPRHTCYVEPFGGMASVLMRKDPSRVEVYNDLSSEVVNLFRVLRDDQASQELRRMLDLTPYAREELFDAYAPANDPIERARRTIVLASMAYNAGKGLKRNHNGFRTSSSGYHRMPQDFMSSTRNLAAITSRLKEVIIENRNYKNLIEQHDSKTTLFYVDPPYLRDTRSDRDSFYHHEFDSEQDHEQLAEVLKKVKGFVILSGYPSALYEKLYMGWHTESTMAVTGAAVPGKSIRTEVIWMNKRVVQVQPQLKLTYGT